MTKEQAIKLLSEVINNLKLTKAEYDTLTAAINKLAE